MTALVAVALVSLCIGDASLVGYRAVCGRSGFIRRSPLVRRAAIRGALVGIAAVATLGLWFGVLLGVAEDRARVLDELTRSGTAMLAVYAGLAVITTVSLGTSSVAPTRWASLAAVTVLGPLTLLRPFVLLTGLVMAVAVAGPRRGAVTASVAIVVVVVVGETVVLDRWGRRAAAAYLPEGTGD